MNEKKISWIVTLILALIIVRHVIEIITNLIRLNMAEDSFTLIANILLSVGMITALAFILQKKKTGVYLFFCLQLLIAVFNSIIGGDAVHLFVAILMCGIMYLILQIRENGVSAWKIIMGAK